MPASIPALFGSKSFSCPHCGAHSDQTWLNVYGKQCKENSPFLADKKTLDDFSRDKSQDFDAARFEELKEYLLKASSDLLFFESSDTDYTNQVINLHLSRCYSCKKITIWHRDKLLYPRIKYEIEPNPDLPADIQDDFNEARSVLDISPRSSAALLRLCVQKLCIFLGKPGKNINDDIASFVKEGLDPRVQKALDFVRVVGNESLHPGQLDMKDNREVAAKLFTLINSIAHSLITHPKELDALYEELPQSKLKEIEKRDTK